MLYMIIRRLEEGEEEKVRGAGGQREAVEHEEGKTKEGRGLISLLIKSAMMATRFQIPESS